MINPDVLDESFREFYNNFSKWLPDGFININLKTLNELGLLSSAKIEEDTPDSISHKFHVIETNERVTLYNDQFVIWILPRSEEGEVSSTMTMIALLQNHKPHLEIVYTNTGIYNTPRYILKVLEHFISEVTDTEAIISSIGKRT